MHVKRNSTNLLSKQSYMYVELQVFSTNVEHPFLIIKYCLGTLNNLK